METNTKEKLSTMSPEEQDSFITEEFLNKIQEIRSILEEINDSDITLIVEHMYLRNNADLEDTIAERKRNTYDPFDDENIFYSLDSIIEELKEGPETLEQLKRNSLQDVKNDIKEKEFDDKINLLEKEIDELEELKKSYKEEYDEVKKGNNNKQMIFQFLNRMVFRGPLAILGQILIKKGSDVATKRATKEGSMTTEAADERIADLEKQIETIETEREEYFN